MDKIFLVPAGSRAKKLFSLRLGRLRRVVGQYGGWKSGNQR